jgi:hypothetical protein
MSKQNAVLYRMFKATLEMYLLRNMPKSVNKLNSHQRNFEIALHTILFLAELYRIRMNIFVTALQLQQILQLIIY